MATWKKVIVSGSQAELAAVTASLGVLVGTNQSITTTQAGTFLTGSFTGSFKGDGSNLTGVTATAIFPTTAITNVTSTDKFFVSQSSNQYITYGDLLTDLAGTNLAVESSDSLTLATTITGITSITSTAFTGSLLGTASTASFVTTAQTASYVLTAKTASYFDTTNLNQNVVVNSGYYLQVNTYSKTFSGDVPNMDSIGSPWNVVQVNFTTYPHKSIFVRYVLDDALTPGANMRAGNIMVVSDGSGNINLTEVTTQDIGDTTPVDFTATITGGNTNVIQITILSGTWDIRFDYTII